MEDESKSKGTLWSMISSPDEAEKMNGRHLKGTNIYFPRITIDFY